VVERIETGLEGVCLIRPRVFTDHRGFFMESYSERAFADLGITCRFVQDNHSRSRRGVLRGLHYQIRHSQAKLVRVTLGRVFDVAVDIRRGSPSFGRWVGAELSDDNRLMLFAPAGFAHGFLVLSEDAEFQYKCSDFYTPEAERGVAWDDPEIGIEWPIQDLQPILSDKDLANVRLCDVAEEDLPVFDHGGEAS
jgi:dTDP-4-dehydrorhamnose 3,5-epimerase